jgi:hypothetical protein
MELLSTTPIRHDQAGVLEDTKVLHDAETGHHETPLELTERLSIPPKQHVQQAAPRGVGERLEYRVHSGNDM